MGVRYGERTSQLLEQVTGRGQSRAGYNLMQAARTANILKTNIVKNCVLACLLAGAALVPCVAAAALGEPETSVTSDVAELRGSIRTAERASYRVHEIRLPSGTLVREFTAPGGNVFAVSWRGPVVPILRQTLGRYFDSYAAAAKAHHSRHRQVQIHRSDLVVQVAGHMRAFSGVAYLPPVVPYGVHMGDLD